MISSKESELNSLLNNDISQTNQRLNQQLSEVSRQKDFIETQFGKSIDVEVEAFQRYHSALGETDEEIVEAMQLLRDAGVDLLTIGQYLAPSKNHLAIDRFPEPELYDIWAQKAIEMGFSGVASGPLVRSSYKAGLLMRKTLDENNTEEMLGAYVLVQPKPTNQHALMPSHSEVEQ